MAAHLGNTADVFVAVLLRETEVLVQTEADIIAVESVRGQADVKQMLLQGRGDRGLARGRETSEPDCEPALSAQLVALVAGERGVPGDIPALCHSVFVDEWHAFQDGNSRALGELRNNRDHHPALRFLGDVLTSP